MTNARLGNLTIPHFFAGQVAKWAKEKKRPAITFDLAPAIQEVEVQTQILGASFLKVHIEDPEWNIISSGLIEVEEDGLLTPIQVEYPEKSKHFWQLAAIEGSTEVSQANLVLTFEDIIVARFREQWGHKTFPAGLKTRAEVVKALCDEVNAKEHLKPPIKFVCPGLTRIEPLEPSTEEKTQTAIASENATTKAHRGQGIHAGASFKIKGADPSPTQRALANEVMGIANSLKSGQLASEALIEACIDENDFTNTGEGILQVIPSTAASLGISSLNVKQCVEAFLLKGFGGLGGAIAYAKAHPNAPAHEVAQAVQASGAGAATKGAANYGKFQLEAQEIIHAYGGATIGSGATAESDVGQLTRGTPQNPDEDSWDCGTRLAQQVDWFLFTEWRHGRDTLFYMDGPDLVKQKPSLYIDVPKNHVIKESLNGKKISEQGVLIRPLTFNYDNTTLIYRSTHKVKGRIQRKSRIGKPQTPSEIRMLMICEPEEFQAGDVFVFKHSGPISDCGGRWIVSDATRQTMKYPYTQFILVPPQEPLPEPRASASSETSTASQGGSGSALAAFNASSTLSNMELPYLWGGGHGTNGLSNVKKGGPGLDCSGSTCWVLKQAGMFPGSSAIVSGELEKFGEAGKGKEMTVWANATHVFIEFNIPGHGRAQMNTNGPSNGARLYTLSETMTFNPDPEKEGFIPRHWQGT